MKSRNKMCQTTDKKGNGTGTLWHTHPFQSFKPGKLCANEQRADG